MKNRAAKTPRREENAKVNTGFSCIFLGETFAPSRLGGESPSSFRCH
ncbi:MAG: hypothetical protein KAX60_08010 [Azonexus sp.]|jgi:hypothetical protein|nr:hypothetical protein [Azonexus sp.]HRF30665.1 hypothetical protein [Azonexus sp.]